MIPDLTKAHPPLALTVGFFDGVHLGHRGLFKALSSLGHSVCVTFQNHPAEVLRPGQIPPLLTPHKTRLAMIDTHVDTLVALPFSAELATLSPQAFVKMLRTHIPFSHLLLGYDGRLGKDREGTPEVLKEIGKQEGFEVTYLEPIGGREPVSSGRIRQAVQAGEMERAEALLGYPYTMTGVVIPGPKAGRKVGFPTANLDPEGQVLPPFGVYAVTARVKGKSLAGVANLGVAPTLHTDRKPLLEVYLFDTDEELYGEELSACLHHFIRKERNFASMKALKSQIQKDVALAEMRIVRTPMP